DSAENLLTGVIESARQTTELEKETVRAANIALIFERWGRMHAAQLAGNSDKVKDLDQRAQEAVKAAAQIEGIAFPALPEKLQAALPAPAAPATAPTTEPSAATAPSASADDNSPDQQAVRAVLVSFADAIDKGDVEAARGLCQIEPGQDQTLAD